MYHVLKTEIVTIKRNNFNSVCSSAAAKVQRLQHKRISSQSRLSGVTRI